jgi:hypothetical protein
MVSPRWRRGRSIHTTTQRRRLGSPSRSQPRPVPRRSPRCPLGLFEPFSDDVGEKTAVHANVNPVAREQYRRLAATLHHVQAERG